MAKATQNRAIIKPNQSVNLTLFHRAVRRAVDIERLKTGEVRSVMSLLNRSVLPDIDRQIADRLGRIALGEIKNGYTDYRLQALKESIGGMIKGGMHSVSEMLQGRLTQLAHSESTIEVSALKGAITVPFDFIAPAPNLLKAIVTERPFEGRILGDWFSDLAQKYQREIPRQINIGLVQGESVPDLVRRIRGSAEAAFGDGTAGAIRRDVEAVVRTAVGSVSSAARAETYAANADVVKGVQWIATLDPRTCEICMARDGQVFDLDGNIPMPPSHWNCRCTTAPVLKSWKELGIDAKEADAGTRASMDGEVPATMTYGQWLKEQSEKVQNDALGPTRAEMFRTGKVAIDRFVDDRSQWLTLDQIRRREGLN